MRYSKMFGRTTKQPPKDEESINAKLLIQGGFVQKEMAGVYVFLPLGLRVLNKIVQVIREEINNVGGQELYLSALQSKEIWSASGRWDDEAVDVWFKTKLGSGTELGLAPTHEEPLANLLSKYVKSYKDLPLYVYQFQTKFRNELRAKSGLLRTREFLMKDLYSFTKNQSDLDEFYEEVKGAYFKIFERLGIGKQTFLTFASGGSFSKYSHEFQTVVEAGEDTIYLDRKKKIAINNEVYTDEVIKDLGLDKGSLEEVKGVEVGNIFKQGTKFSEPLGLKFTDEDGNEKPVIMGAYGIGPARVMATIVELYNDGKGILWPETIAPYKLHITVLNPENGDVCTRVKTLYKKLVANNIEVLIDDRIAVSAGEKFADADLIGCPYRAVISEKSGEKIELKKRNEKDAKLITVSELENLLGI